MTGVSINALCHFLCISCTPLLSLLITALTLSHFPAVYSSFHLSMYTQNCLLLSHSVSLHLSLSLSLYLPSCLSLFLILASPDWSLFLPGFSFCPSPPISSTNRSLLHSRQSRHILRAQSLLWLTFTFLSLFLTHLCRSFSHIISLFTPALQQKHICYSAIAHMYSIYPQ